MKLPIADALCLPTATAFGPAVPGCYWRSVGAVTAGWLAGFGGDATGPALAPLEVAKRPRSTIKLLSFSILTRICSDDVNRAEALCSASHCRTRLP